jgi:hypothetical protein
MIEPALRRFLAYEKRKEAVIIGTILAGLVMVWPAADEYIAARQRTHDVRIQREEAEVEIAKLPQFTRMQELKTKELEVLAKQLVEGDAARKLQSDLMELGRQTGCTVLRAQLSDPSSRVWNENDHPVPGSRLRDPGAETPFQLDTRQLSLSIAGPMNGLYAFLEGLHRVDKVVHARAMAIKGGNAGDESNYDTGTLDMNLLLFDLTKRENG